MDDGAVRVGLVGYGSAGRGIHAPLLREAGLDIRLVATADPGRRRDRQRQCECDDERARRLP